MLGEEAVQAALKDWRSAPLAPPLRETLGFLEKLTLDPDGVGPLDVAPLRAAGASDAAIAEAVHIAALFNLIDRVADALGFEVPSPHELKAAARHLLRRGYRS